MNMSVNHLHNAKCNIDNEWYTSIETVEAELSHWRHRLRGKKIICPTDSEQSAFVKYLNSVKEEWGIKSVDYSCLPYKDMFDVDYSKYDIVITNPPFSGYGKYLDLLDSYNIDYILIAPYLSINQTCWYKRFKKFRIFSGFNKSFIFKATNKTNNKKSKVICWWVTTFDDYNISTKQFDCPDWTEYTITQWQYVGTYDYDFIFGNVPDKKLLGIKKGSFRIYLKKR